MSLVRKIELVETEHMDPSADDAGTVCIILVIIYIYTWFALIVSEKNGNLIRIVCDPIAFHLIFVCLVPTFNTIYKKYKINNCFKKMYL